MGPKEIAKFLTEDPDIINEDYPHHCTACGGWDKAQGGRGHNPMCPVGKAGTPIGTAQYVKPEAIIQFFLMSGNSEPFQEFQELTKDEAGQAVDISRNEDLSIELYLSKLPIDVEDNTPDIGLIFVAGEYRGIGLGGGEFGDLVEKTFKPYIGQQMSGKIVKSLLDNILK